MAEETAENSAAEGAESQTEQTETQQGTEVPPEVKAALRKANKEAETLRTKLKEFEDRDKTEIQKANERAEAAEKLAATHETSALRLSVAFEKGLTPAQAKRLVGSTRDELEADADEVLKDFPATASRPRGDVGQGSRGKPAPADPRSAFAALFQQ
jgi:hypothetical protein